MAETKTTLRESVAFWRTEARRWEARAEKGQRAAAALREVLAEVSTCPTCRPCRDIAALALKCPTGEREFRIIQAAEALYLAREEWIALTQTEQPSGRPWPAGEQARASVAYRDAEEDLWSAVETWPEDAAGMAVEATESPEKGRLGVGVADGG